MKFHIIITEFRNKLPRPQNKAKKLTDEEKNQIPLIKESSLKYFSVLNVGTQKVSLSEADIDEFYNKMNNFDFSFILFRNYYQKYINNLNRFNPTAENNNFDLSILQEVLEKNKLKPTKPFAILWFHIKYEYKITSKFHEWYVKRKLTSKLSLSKS